MFDNYADYEALLAQVQLVLFMMGMGATLAIADFLTIFRQPRYLVVGAICQFLISPLLALFVNWAFDLPPGIAVGLILVAVMPGGNLSKVFAYLGRGNLALSITLTKFGTVAALITVPLSLRFFAVQYVSDDFEMPVGQVMADVLLFMLLPLAVGMGVARWQPERRMLFSRWCIRLGFVFVLAMIVGSLGSGRIDPGDQGWKVPLAIIFFCLLTQQVSMLLFRLRGWPAPDCLAVGIEATMRNVNLALLLKARLFPAGETADPIGDGVLFTILFYAAAAMGAGLPLALRFRRKAKRAAQAVKEAEGAAAAKAQNA